MVKKIKLFVTIKRFLFMMAVKSAMESIYIKCVLLVGDLFGYTRGNMMTEKEAFDLLSMSIIYMDMKNGQMVFLSSDKKASQYPLPPFKQKLICIIKTAINSTGPLPQTGKRYSRLAINGGINKRVLFDEDELVYLSCELIENGHLRMAQFTMESTGLVPRRSKYLIGFFSVSTKYQDDLYKKLVAASKL